MKLVEFVPPESHPLWKLCLQMGITDVVVKVVGQGWSRTGVRPGRGGAKAICADSAVRARWDANPHEQLDKACVLQNTRHGVPRPPAAHRRVGMRVS